MTKGFHCNIPRSNLITGWTSFPVLYDGSYYIIVEYNLVAVSITFKNFTAFQSLEQHEAD